MAPEAAGRHSSGSQRRWQSGVILFPILIFQLYYNRFKIYGVIPQLVVLINLFMNLPGHSLIYPNGLCRENERFIFLILTSYSYNYSL